MKPEEIALPWFPITPDYIDKYHDSVLRYLRDTHAQRRDNLAEDSSYQTTLGLIFQRAAQIVEEIGSTPLKEAEQYPGESLQRDIRILAAAAYLCDDSKDELRRQYLIAIAYWAALLKPDISDYLVPLCLRFMRVDRIINVGYDLDAIVNWDLVTFIKKLNSASLQTGTSERWFENHGTIRMDRNGLSLFDINRFFLGMKLKQGVSFKSVLSVEDGTIQLLQDKKDKHAFSISRFIESANSIVPQEVVEEKKKVYEDGDELTVRVMQRGYEDVHAESIDPSYETVAGPVEIVSASNVRGIYMTDVARNVGLGTHLNVIYDKDSGRFVLDDIIIQFIRKKFWEDDAEAQQYMRMNAMLLFPQKGKTKNTWLTEHGFLVRTEYESIPRYALCSLEILDYDDNLDFFQAKIVDGLPESYRFKETDARDSLLQLLLNSSKTILTPAPQKPVVRRIEPVTVSMLHRILAVKEDNALNGSANKEGYLGICCALAAIAGDEEDLSYYNFKRHYLQRLIAFAERRFKEIKELDSDSSTDKSILMKRLMVRVLMEYNNPQESEILQQVISDLEDTESSAVAKLVQASNRFIGSLSLERLRNDLHREICSQLKVSDAIITEGTVSHTEFPFPSEDDRTEHKMSWVYDNATSFPNETEQSFKILKTVCAFMNRYPDQGEGHVYIGTDETHRRICGIQPDIDFLIEKGILSAKGDLNDEYCRHIMSIIRNRFPDSFQYVSLHFIEDGRVLDIVVSPAVQGIVYLHGVPYFRSSSSSIEMPASKRQEIRDRKYLLHNEMSDKIDAIGKAIQTERVVVLKSYDSSNSNTSGSDRMVEAFAFVDNGRFDAIWAYDFSGKEKRNKVFLLRRAESVEVTDRPWKHARLHTSFPLDMFGYYGDEKIPFKIMIRTTRAKNLLVEQYPDAQKYIEEASNDWWQVKGELYNKLSLAAACGYYLSIADDIEILDSPEFTDYVVKRLTSLVEILL